MVFALTVCDGLTLTLVLRSFSQMREARLGKGLDVLRADWSWRNPTQVCRTWLWIQTEQRTSTPGKGVGQCSTDTGPGPQTMKRDGQGQPLSSVTTYLAGRLAESFHLSSLSLLICKM